MKILNYGSINVDHVYKVDTLVAPGETKSCRGFQIFPGGKGMNQSIALAKAGAPVYHAGKVGHDGQWLIKMMQEAGVDTSCTETIDTETGRAIIQVDETGQNGILIYDGANGKLDTAFAQQVLEQFEEGDILLLQNEVNGINEVMDAAWDKGMRIAFNPSPANEKIKACDLNKVTWLLLNEIEGEWLTGEKEPERMAARLTEDYPDMKVVLTLGSKGGIYKSKEEEFFFPAKKVKAVDTTGAGDTFTGYFLSCTAKGKTPKEAADMAVRAAAIAVTREGAAVSIPSYDEV